MKVFFKMKQGEGTHLGNLPRCLGSFTFGSMHGRGLDELCRVLKKGKALFYLRTESTISFLFFVRFG